ncbi:MAG: SLBB domain-containing protein, partial [Pyrinomonadaceae bacterium]
MKRNIFLFSALLFCFFQTSFAQEVVPADVAISRGYLLGPGDEVTVKVLGEPQFDFVAAVSEDGKIEVPFLDQPILATCRTEREIRSEVSKVLSKYLRSPQVNLSVTARKSRQPVIVSGEVRKPLEVTMYRKARLMELMSAAGGLTEEAGGSIQVFRTRAPICGDPEEISEWQAQAANNGGTVTGMYSFSNLRTGAAEANPVIYPGDIIIAMKAAPVYITGEVKGAGALHIPEGGLSLFQAVAMLGGETREAKTKDIKIYRLKADSKDRETLSVNFDEIKKGERKDMMLEPYDIVQVGKSKPGILSTLLKTV